MSSKLPYEDTFERQMNNLPSTQEDESWRKMKKLLDDKDKPLPFAYIRNYKALYVLIILLLMSAWLVIHKYSTKEKHVATVNNNVVTKQKILTDHSGSPINKKQKATLKVSDNLPETVNNQDIHSSKTVSGISNNKTAVVNKAAVSISEESRISTVKKIVKKNRKKQNNLESQKSAFVKQINIAETKPADLLTKSNYINSGKILKDSQKNGATADTLSVTEANQNKLTDQQKDTSFTKKDDITKETAASQKPTLNKPKKYLVSAGIGEQQQIAIGGQQMVSYGYNGNKNIFSDYTPSLYFRFERDQKWFLQMEFSYKAPQLVKSFAYSQQTILDSTAWYTTTTLRLKKTFYNQIPVSFNYYIRHNLSIGLGGMYSWFSGAIAEKEIMTKNVQTQAQSIVENIVPIKGYTDSFLYRSHTYLLFQIDYVWRRFSLGLRYTKDLQPFIKYTLPDGTIKDQKNWSLQFMLRFRLWKSTKF